MEGQSRILARLLNARGSIRVSKARWANRSKRAVADTCASRARSSCSKRRCSISLCLAVSNMGEMSLRRLVYCEFRLGNMPQKGYVPNAQPPIVVTCLPSNDLRIFLRGRRCRTIWSRFRRSRARKFEAVINTLLKTPPVPLADITKKGEPNQMNGPRRNDHLGSEKKHPGPQKRG
jgi:hypothetical protein